MTGQLAADAAPPTITPRARILWLDAARGIAVIAVILMHYQVWVVNAYDRNPGVATSTWAEFSALFGPIRMPLLFLISGVLASETLLKRAPRVAMRRIASSFYLVIVWTIVFALLGQLTERSLPGKPGTWASFGMQLITPSSILWFVYSLGASSLIVFLLRRLPAWAPLILFLTVPALVRFANLGLGQGPWRAVMYSTFFAIGVYAAKAIIRGFGRRPLPILAVSAPLYAVLDWAENAIPPTPFLSHAVWEGKSLAAACAALAVIVLLCKWEWLGTRLAWVGQRTLPIFLLHLPLAWTVLAIGPLHDLFFASELRWLWPVIGVTYLVGGALILNEVISRTWLRVLFVMPGARMPARSKARDLAAAEPRP